ncbi:1861_t:CDS:2, partial [Racocetra fulgida]
MWARGYFELLDSDLRDESDSIPVLVQCQNVGDFYVDDRRLFGDVYGYKNSWHVLYLHPGMHVINVRLVNEIRIFGGKIPPDIRFQCFIKKLELQQIGAMVLDHTIIVPDLVDGFLAGKFASVAILNTQEKSWITVSNVNVINSNVNVSTPAAAYTKIQSYVPYYWNSESHLDPILKGILESSIAEYNNDLYTTNLVGIPILARVGSDDDNVPPLHSRMLVRLVNEHSGNPQAIKLSEIPGKGHWFDKVMSDDVMQEFLDEHLKINHLNQSDSCPKEFIIILLNPASFGSKCGIQ